MKKIQIPCAFGIATPANLKNPPKKYFDGWAVNGYFAIRRATPKDSWSGWAVIHIPSGLAAATAVALKADAIKCAHELTDAYGEKWNFTDRETARTFKDARTIVMKYHHTA